MGKAGSFRLIGVVLVVAAVGCARVHAEFNCASDGDCIDGALRGVCQQTGFCFQGCKWGAKWSTLYTEIPKGEKTGNMEVRPDSHVRHPGIHQRMRVGPAKRVPQLDCRSGAVRLVAGGI